MSLLFLGNRTATGFTSLLKTMQAPYVPVRRLATSSGSPPIFPFSRPFGAQPALEFSHLRTHNPVSKVTLWDGSTAWLVTRYTDVCQVLNDNRFSRVRTHPNYPELGPGGRVAAMATAHQPSFVDMDAPEHTKQRSAVEFAFLHDTVDTMRSNIQNTVDEHIDKMKNDGCAQPVDLIEKFALPVTLQIVYRLLGIPVDDMKYITSCNAVRTSGSTTSGEAAEASKNVIEYLRKLVTTKDENPGDDLISNMVVNHLRTGQLTHEAITQITFLLLVAGNATVVSMTSLGIVTLLQHPYQLEILRKDPTLMPRAVEEILRFHTASALATRRVALADVELGGQIIKAGEGVIASNQSANRDERIFQNPDSFNIYREPNSHLAYGYGRHECVAKWLASTQLQIMLQSLFRQFPRLSVAIPFEQIKYTPSNKDVGIVELPVTW